MTPAVEQIVREAMELTGAPVPALLEEDAPVLSDDALATVDEGEAALVDGGQRVVGKDGGVLLEQGRDGGSGEFHCLADDLFDCGCHGSSRGRVQGTWPCGPSAKMSPG